MIYIAATLRFILGPNLFVDPPKSARFILFRVGTPRSGLQATRIKWTGQHYRRILTALIQVACAELAAAGWLLLDCFAQPLPANLEVLECCRGAVTEIFCSISPNASARM